MIGTFHNAGLFVSLPLTGIISDKYGRKKALSIAALMNGIFGVLRSFSVNYYMLVAFEFLEAACGAGAYTTAFVLGKAFDMYYITYLCNWNTFFKLLLLLHYMVKIIYLKDRIEKINIMTMGKSIH